MGREFTDCEKETLDRIRAAAEDPTGVEKLALVHSSRDGEPCSVLCILTSDASLGHCRLQPVAIMISAEEATRLDNPSTGVPGLPWTDAEPEQIKLKGIC